MFCRGPRKKLLFEEAESEVEEEAEGQRERIEGLKTLANSSPAQENDSAAHLISCYNGNEIFQAADNILELTPEIGKSITIGTNTEKISPFTTALTNDKKLNTATGLQSFKLLDALTIAVSKLLEKNKKVVIRTKKYKLSLKDRIILTLAKLKQNLSFVMLSLLFGVSNACCRRIFKDTIIMLSVVLKPAIPWPSSQSIQRLLPLCFENFPNVRVVLDCTEIFIQRPKCLNCRIKVFIRFT